MCMLCRSLFVLLYFFFWSLCCLYPFGFFKLFLAIPQPTKSRIEEEQTIQWPNEKGQKDNQRSTKHTYKTKDRVTRTALKTGGELRCSGRVGSSCSTSGTRRVNLVTNPVMNREWGKDREVFTTSGIYPWSFVTQIVHNGQPSHGRTVLTVW